MPSWTSVVENSKPSLNGKAKSLSLLIQRHQGWQFLSLSLVPHTVNSPAAGFFSQEPAALFTSAWFSFPLATFETELEQEATIELPGAALEPLSRASLEDLDWASLGARIHSPLGFLPTTSAYMLAESHLAGFGLPEHPVGSTNWKFIESTFPNCSPKFLDNVLFQPIWKEHVQRGKTPFPCFLSMAGVDWVITWQQQCNHL